MVMQAVFAEIHALSFALKLYNFSLQVYQA